MKIPGLETPAIGQVEYCIEALWCDADGVWLTGWAQANGAKIQGGFLHSGGVSAEITDFADRPGVAGPFPVVDGNVPRGFSCYLACRPFRPLLLTVATSHGVTHLDVEAPPTPPYPPLAASHGKPAPVERFIAEMKQAGGTVLEIGARVVGPHSSLMAPRFAPECRFLGSDIHDAPGVDIVADAHFLSRSVARNSLDGVFSLAVVEHIAAPWMVAAEINRVLKPGGLTMHVLPQSFPVHEVPNDFWRMTDEALKVLFGPATGFEVLEAGMAQPVQIIPPPALRFGSFLNLPRHRGFSSAFVLSRKVAEIPDGAVAWPMPQAEMFERSAAYPSHKPAAPAAS